MSNSLWPHGLQHHRILCPLVTPGDCPNSCSLSPWSYVTISSPVAPFSFCFQSFPASGSFPVSWLFTSGGRSEFWSFSFIIGPSNEYSGLISSRIDWSDLLAVQGILKSLFQHHNSKASVLQFSAFFMIQLSHLYMISGKNFSFTCMDLCQQINVPALTVLITTNWKILKKVAVSDHLNLSPEKSVCGSRSNS